MRIFLHPLLRHKIRAHPFGCVSITCKLRIPILLCQAAMIFMSGAQERGAGRVGLGKRRVRQREREENVIGHPHQQVCYICNREWLFCFRFS
jgi:hypothetical protein